MGVLCVTAATSYHRANYDLPLSALCRDVEVFHYGPNMSAAFWWSDGARLRAAANAELRALAARMRSDGRLTVVFLSAYDDFLEVETLRLFNRLGALIVNHMVDMPTQWFRVLKSAPYFDCLAVAHHAHEEYLQRVTGNILYLPMAADPTFYEPSTDVLRGTGPALSFVGTYTPVRARVLRAVLGVAPELEIYGNWARNKGPGRSLRRRAKLSHDIRWYGAARVIEEGRDLLPVAAGRVRDALSKERLERLRGLSRGPLPFQGMVDMFASSRINLGITQSQGAVGASHMPRWVRGRDFEVPMCGGFYLVQRAPEQDLHFVLGREIETWETLGELAEKVRHFLRYPEEAQQIAARGRARAQRDHTWAVRYRSLFRHLGVEPELDGTQAG